MACGRRRSSCSKSASSHTLDTDEYDIVEKGKDDLLTWNIPTLPTSKIYKTNLFTHFSRNSLLKTKEGNSPLSNGGGYLNLIREDDDLWHLQNKYRTIHIGMVQIGVKALTRGPLNAKVLLCLRDARHRNLQDSLLGMVEANLKDGPLYFNVFPNIVESLSAPRLDDLLFLNAKVREFEQLPEGPKNIVVMYRVCYKVLKPGVETRVLLKTPSNGRTIFFQTDFETAMNDFEQGVTVWNEVQLPENWPTPRSKSY
ncbi:hypothetical protein SDJN03_16758, partial [Cucurbita argyrosperma subsp. sororia]